MEGIRILHPAAADMLSSGDRPLAEFDGWYSNLPFSGRPLPRAISTAGDDKEAE